MAITPNLATFRALYPEFGPVSDERIEIYLDDALDTLLPSVWGQCYAKAVLSYAAHYLSLSEQRLAGMSVDEDTGAVSVAPSGVVTSASAEGLSVGFAAPNSNTGEDVAFWSQSPYGQNYLALRRQCLGRGELSW